MLFALLGPIGTNELVIILIIVLLIFGPSRLPGFAEALGKSIRKFRQATSEARDEIEKASTDKKDDGGDKKD